MSARRAARPAPPFAWAADGSATLPAAWKASPR